MTGVKVASGELVDVAWLNQLARGAYRKTTAKQVLNSVAETDLLNGEVTLAAGCLGSTGMIRLTAWGDYVQNSGAARDVQRFKLKLGGTTLFDTNVTGSTVVSASATRRSWKIDAMIANTNATNVQSATFREILDFAALTTTLAGKTAFTTGEGSLGTTMANGSQADCVEGIAATTGAIDTTVALALVLSVINPTATATMDTTLLGALVEVI